MPAEANVAGTTSLPSAATELELDIARAQYKAALEAAQADVAASDAAAGLEPSFIDVQIEETMNVWFVAYKT